jgi:hypothetical protein
MFSCPHCNSVVSVEAGRVPCPRCGELFDTAAAEQLPHDAAESPVAPLPPKPGFLYSRTAILLSFGLAFLIFAVGMAVVRPWEPRVTQKQEIRPPVVVSPLGLSGLAYLPPTTNVAAAVQPMPLLAYAAITKTDPRKFLIDAGVPEQVFATLDRAGVPLDQIDHLVVGATFRTGAGQVLPDVTACLKLTRPIADEEKFLTALKAEKNSQQSKVGHTVYNVTSGLLMTKLDGQTYLFGMDADDLAFHDKPHAAGGGHLPKELREAMTSKVSPASFVWLATDTQDWAAKDVVKIAALSQTLKDRIEKLKAVRGAAAGLSLEPDPELRLGVRWADAAGATAFQQKLKAAFPTEKAAVAGDDGWGTVVTPFDPKAEGLKGVFAEWFGKK